MPATGKFFSIITNVISPSSFGSIKITSPSVFTPPLIDPALLATNYDLATLREGVKVGYELMRSHSMSSDFIVAPWGGLADALNVGTDAAIEAFVANYTTTVWHPTGSVLMTKPNGQDGVLDPECNVIGTVGLRVVDASSFVCRSAHSRVNSKLTEYHIASHPRIECSGCRLLRSRTCG